MRTTSGEVWTSASSRGCVKPSNKAGTPAAEAVEPRAWDQAGLRDCSKHAPDPEPGARGPRRWTACGKRPSGASPSHPLRRSRMLESGLVSICAGGVQEMDVPTANLQDSGPRSAIDGVKRFVAQKSDAKCPLPAQPKATRATSAIRRFATSPRTAQTRKYRSFAERVAEGPNRRFAVIWRHHADRRLRAGTGNSVRRQYRRPSPPEHARVSN